MGTSPTQFGVWADNLVGHPEKWRDFGWRSTHLMTQFSKALIQEFYGKPANHSYFAGCSTGGQQALMEAARFPYDYDGILAGAPAFNRTHLHTVSIAQYKATHELSAFQEEAQMKAQSLPTDSNVQEPQSLPTDPNVQEPMFTRALREASQTAQLRAAKPLALAAKTGSVWEKLDIINAAVLKECLGQALGPKTDTFLTDPRDCKFDPATLQCPGTPNCLTTDQVAAMRVYYEGAVNPSNGAIINPGNVPSSETSNVFAMGFAFNEINRKMEPAFDSLFKWVFNPPPWQWRTFDFDHNVTAIDDALALDLNANSTDLWRFKKPRWEANSLFRLGRPDNSLPLDHQLLQCGHSDDVWQPVGRSADRNAEIRPPIHGARHVALRDVYCGRSRAELIWWHDPAARVEF